MPRNSTVYDEVDRFDGVTAPESHNMRKSSSAILAFSRPRQRRRSTRSEQSTNSLAMQLLPAILFALAAASAPIGADAVCDIIGVVETFVVDGSSGLSCSDSTGFVFQPLRTEVANFPFDDKLSSMCATPSCVEAFTQLNAAYPTECQIFEVFVRADYVDKFAAGCGLPPFTPPPPPSEPGYCNPLLFNAVGAATSDGLACTNQTGFSLMPTDFHAPSDAEIAKLCKSPQCLRVIADLNSEFSTECLLFEIPLRETFLDKFPAACTVATMTPSPTPTPTTTQPPVVNGPCGNDQVGAKACTGGQYCQPWSPTEYQCRSIDAKCGVQETGVDYSGDDLATFQLTLPDDCCAKCSSTVGCTGYTFVNYNADGKAYCYLKKGQGNKVTKVAAVSATIVLSPSPSPTPTPSPALNGPCGNEQVGPKACSGGQYCQPWSPTEYQCRSIAASCGVPETGVDYSGDDLATFQLTLPEDCCAKCSSTVGCTGYTFVNCNADGKGYCYLKKGPGTRTSVVGAVSATITPSKCSRQFPGVDFYGSDLTSVSGVTTTACCEKCAATSGCKAYTYVGSTSTCYLKSGSSDRRTGAVVVSALLN